MAKKKGDWQVAVVAMVVIIGFVLAVIFALDDLTGIGLAINFFEFIFMGAYGYYGGKLKKK